MASIVDPPTDGKTEPTMRGVASLMLRSLDPFTAEVGALLEQVAIDHDQPSTCWSCNVVGDGMCASYEQATATAFAWLLKVVDERG